VDGLSWSLLLAAAGVGLVHTLLGPDHYLPFIMLARARGWTGRRTALVTLACGSGHVISSLLLGGVGVGLGIAVSRLEEVEGGRGSLAAWALVAFGVAYAAWGIRKAIRHSRGLEPHSHGGRVHLHAHGDQSHGHADGDGLVSSRPSFWALFIIFVLGPCEPLVPLFVLPASRDRWDLALAAAVVFGVITVGTMVGMTMLGWMGLKTSHLGRLSRWDHVLAGGVIALSGLAILFLGL
jgi:hypothetical protein